MLTDDHSLLGECLRSGYLTPDLAGAFPYKHLVTRSLGADELVEVDVRVIEPLPGDVVMVCSDGLSGVVDDAEIARLLDAEADRGTIIFPSHFGAPHAGRIRRHGSGYRFAPLDTAA